MLLPQNFLLSLPLRSQQEGTTCSKPNTNNKVEITSTVQNSDSLNLAHSSILQPSYGQTAGPRGMSCSCFRTYLITKILTDNKHKSLQSKLPVYVHSPHGRGVSSGSKITSHHTEISLIMHHGAREVAETFLELILVFIHPLTKNCRKFLSENQISSRKGNSPDSLLTLGPTFLFLPLPTYVQLILFES